VRISGHDVHCHFSVQNRVHSWTPCRGLEECCLQVVLSSSVSSSNSFSVSACFFFEPKPSDWRRFISASRVARKSAKSLPLKMSMPGNPFQRRNLMIPQHRWCRESGGYSEPSCLRTSRTNLVSQCCCWLDCCSIKGGMLSPHVFWR